MSEENKTEKKPEVVRGDRGEVGTATPGLTMRQRWAESGQSVSLKTFARGLVREGDPVAKSWFANKRGFLNKKRSEANEKAAREAAAATKLTKKKVKK
jgi:hypothetical protein